MSHDTTTPPARPTPAFVWGYNNRAGLGLGHTDHRGQIGNGSTSDQHTPVVVLGPGIASVGAGNAISAAVTDKGGLQAWGRNSFGQLGLPPVLAPRYGTGGLHEVHEHQLRPASVVLPQGGQAALVDAGQRHMIVVTTDGKLVQFGLGAAGAPQARELALKPSWGRPVQICAGDEFTLIRTSRGLLLSVGGNGDGQLGLGDRRARTTPALVTLPRAHGAVAGIWAGARSGLGDHQRGRGLHLG